MRIIGEKILTLRQVISLFFCIIMCFCVMPSPVFAAGSSADTMFKTYLDIVPAAKDSAGWRNYGTDYYTGYTVQNGICYAGKEGEVLDIPYTAALDLSGLKEATKNLDDLEKVNGSLTFSFQYDQERLEGPVDTTFDLVRRALNEVNPEGSLASLYDVSDMDLNDGRVCITLTLKSEVTGSNLKEALDKSDTLYMKGSFKTKPLEENWDGYDISIRRAKVDAEISCLGESISSTTKDADLPGNIDPGFASDSCCLNVKSGIVKPMEAVTSVELTGKKVLEGEKQTADIKDGQFTFEVISDANNDTSGFSGLNETVPVKAGGAIDFGTLTFTKAGIYNFTLSENDLGETGYTYDKTKYNVEINILQNNPYEFGSGLTITKIGKDGTAEGTTTDIEFINSYSSKIEDKEIPQEGTPSDPNGTPANPSQTADSDVVQTGDNSNIGLWIVMLTLSAIGLVGCFCGLGAKRMRRKAE